MRSEEAVSAPIGKRRQPSRRLSHEDGESDRHEYGRRERRKAQAQHRQTDPPLDGFPISIAPAAASALVWIEPGGQPPPILWIKRIHGCLLPGSFDETGTGHAA